MIDPNVLSRFPSLNRHPLLRDQLQKQGIIQSFEKGHPLLNEGAYVQFIPLVINGLIKVYKEDNEGNEVLLYYIQPGESCIMSLTTCIKEEKSKVKAIVEESSDIFLVPAKLVNPLAKQFPQWNEFFFELFHAKYDELLRVISILTFSNKDVRLKEYLKQEAKLKNNPLIYLTHQQIADDLGSSREVISRLLKKLEKEGILILGHGSIQML